MRRRLPPVLLLAALQILAGCRGEHQGPGTPSDAPLSREGRETRAGAYPILFGDLHVHTTFSMDAFVTSLPMMGGEGAHPPADACDYARFCADLDFWSINDHAESITPLHWEETRKAIRQCNAVGRAGESGPVAFLGWEWSQVGTTPDEHFGHKNVVLRETADAQVPTRPIAAPRPEFGMELPLSARLLLPLRYFPERRRYFDFFAYLEELGTLRPCPEGDVRELPGDCHETAADPAALFAKLDQWGFESLVIPHGTTWGLMTPPGSSWEVQRAAGQHDPLRQKLIEVYSGHGNSEELRAWRALSGDAEALVCPEPTLDYEPCCWRAGEILRGRCEDPASETCEARVRKARRDHVASGVAANRSIPGATVEDWGDCGQCRDCFLPAYEYRPGMSSQYALASGGFRFGAKSSTTRAAASMWTPATATSARLSRTTAWRRSRSALGPRRSS